MCGCSTYECLEVFKSSCDSYVDLNIIAKGTETLIASLRPSSGGILRITVAAIEGTKISLAAASLNEEMSYVLQLFHDTGEAYDNICYNLNVMYYITPVDGGGGSAVPPSKDYSGSQSEAFTGNSLQTQVFEWLNGQPAISITMGTQTYTTDYFTQSGNALTWKNEVVPGQVFSGQVVLTTPSLKPLIRVPVYLALKVGTPDYELDPTKIDGSFANGQTITFDNLQGIDAMEINSDTGFIPPGKYTLTGNKLDFSVRGGTANEYLFIKGYKKV